MAEYGIHHLPVVEGDRPVGMIGLRDLARSTELLAAPAGGVGLGF